MSNQNSAIDWVRVAFEAVGPVASRAASLASPGAGAIVALGLDIVAPIALAVTEALMDGGDPLAVFERERVEQILGDELLSAIALRQALAAPRNAGG